MMELVDFEYRFFCVSLKDFYKIFKVIFDSHFAKQKIVINLITLILIFITVTAAIDNVWLSTPFVSLDALSSIG